MPAAAEPGVSSRPGVKGLLAFLIPLILLGAVIAAFVLTNGAGLNISPAAPVETVQFGRTILRPGQIELHLRNTSPEAITLSQINVNDAIWPYRIAPARTIPRLGSAVITLNYPWVEGEAYAITIFSSNSIAFSTSIPVAAVTPAASRETLWSFTLVGIYVGIIPIALGMLWLPALKNLGRRGTLFLMSATVGLLVYLGIDATAEALESGAGLGGAFQGIGIIAIGIAGTVLLLDAINRHQSRIAADESGRRMSLAIMVAVGMGFHNLGEGLAIGAAYAVGAAALGTFLVIGFILQNVTEGLGIVIPISHDRPRLATLAWLCLIGGAPAILGTWIGGLTDSLALMVLFLAIGAGAVFQVAYEVGRQLVWKDAASNEMPLTAFSGVLAGMMILYITGLAIK